MSELNPPIFSKTTNLNKCETESSKIVDQVEQTNIEESVKTKKTTKKKKFTKKCFCCGKSKRVILLKCRCEKIFCSSHLLPEKHECKFDYKEHSKKILEKGNPKIICPKIAPI